MKRIVVTIDLYYEVPDDLILDNLTTENADKVTLHDGAENAAWMIAADGVIYRGHTTTDIVDESEVDES